MGEPSSSFPIRTEMSIFGLNSFAMTFRLLSQRTIRKCSEKLDVRKDFWQKNPLFATKLATDGADEQA